MSALLSISSCHMFYLQLVFLFCPCFDTIGQPFDDPSRRKSVGYALHRQSRCIYVAKKKETKYPSVSNEVAAQIQEKTGREVRVTVPGHMQRGGSPCPYDRVFASRLGSEAGKLILDNQYGFMVGYKNREIVRVPLEDVAGKLKTVDPDATIVQEAKLLGICFGD